MNKIAVLGLGRFGASVARRLFIGGAEVLAVDQNLRLVEAIQDDVSVAVSCDATDRTNLEAYDVARMDAAVIAIGNNFEASVLVTMHCKDIGVPRVVAKALNALQAKVLREVGADRVVMPEEEMGVRLAEHLVHASVVDFVQLPAGFSLRRIAIPDKWAGQRLSDLKLLNTQRLNLIQIVRLRQSAASAAGESAAKPDEIKVPLPAGDTILQAGDLVDVIGPDATLAKLMRATG